MQKTTIARWEFSGSNDRVAAEYAWPAQQVGHPAFSMSSAIGAEFVHTRGIGAFSLRRTTITFPRDHSH